MECSVCYVDLTVKNIVNTKCNHIFCQECFWKWADENNSCPMCRGTIISKSKIMKEEEQIRNNIYSLMLEETQYYDSLSYLQNELYELENKIFELSKFKKHPEKYMNEYMKKRDEWIKEVKEKTKKQKEDVITQIKMYNVLYDNYKEVLNQINFENENGPIDIELDIELNSILNEPLFEIGLNSMDEIIRTPSPRSVLQSPPPLIRMNNR